MSNDIACKTTNDKQGAYVKAKEICLAHSTIPNESSLGFSQRNTGGRIEATPA
jgi:hypothetical protein